MITPKLTLNPIQLAIGRMGAWFGGLLAIVLVAMTAIASPPAGVVPAAPSLSPLAQMAARITVDHHWGDRHHPGLQIASCVPTDPPPSPKPSRSPKPSPKPKPKPKFSGEVIPSNFAPSQSVLG